jgi:predicted DNA-binding protein (MmcQ/YjbR family)
MSFESDVFLQYRPVRERMIRHGFIRSGRDMVFRGEIMFGKFQAEFRWSGQNEPRITIREDGEEYSLIHVESADGDYVRRIRDACIVWMTELRDACFARKQFCGEQADRISEALLQKFGDMPDDPWQSKYPGIGVFRHPGNNKWYAIIMNTDGACVRRPGTPCDVLTFRAGTDRAAELLRMPGFVPGYHMNHKSWVSVVLDDSIPDPVILAELAAARALLAAGKQRNDAPGVWLVPANPKFFDVVDAFAKKRTILWKQSTDIRVDDTVYLYVGAPYSAILYRCRVMESDIPYSYEDGNLRMDHVMKIRRTHCYLPTQFSFAELKKHGVNAVRGPRRMPGSLLKELEAAACPEGESKSRKGKRTC